MLSSVSIKNKNKSEVSLVFMWTACWEEVMKCLTEPFYQSNVSSILVTWDVGAMSFKDIQLTQKANCEIMIDMEHYMHEQQQIEVSESDKAKF